MTIVPLADVLNGITSDGEGTHAPLPENWMQGRTTYGGLTAALLLEAAMRGQTNLPPLRSAMVNFVGPISAAPTLTTTALRQGRNVTSLEARALVDGKLAATGAFCFGNAIADTQIQQDRPAPDAPAPEDCEPYIPAFAEGFAPAFTKNFQTHLIEGDRPLTGSDRGYIRCWTRHKDPASRTGLASLLCLGDILPPGIYPMLKSPGPNSSMNWLCNFLDDDPRTEDGWWQVETTMTAAGDGYSSQVMRAWNRQGKLIIDGMQACLTFA